MIRPARAEDAEGIAAIWNPVIRDTTIIFASTERPPAEVAAIIAERQAGGHGFWVAEEDGAILGFATYFPFRAGTGYARTKEHTILLAPHTHGRGIGRALMAAVEDHARAAGAHSIYAGVSGENAQGIAFHAALGYETAAILTEAGFKFGRWLDLHLMRKFL